VGQPERGGPILIRADPFKGQTVHEKEGLEEPKKGKRESLRERERVGKGGRISWRCLPRGIWGE